MNKGIDLAKGKYLFFLGADDLLIKNSLKDLFMYINNKESNKLISLPVIIDDKKVYPDISFPVPIIHHQGALFKKDILKKIGKYSINYMLHSDFDLMNKFVNLYKVEFIDIPICKFRKGGKSTSGVNSIISIIELITIYFQNKGKILSKKWLMFIVRPVYYYIKGLLK
jgi:hypothetical protein